MTIFPGLDRRPRLNLAFERPRVVGLGERDPNPVTHDQNRTIHSELRRTAAGGMSRAKAEQVRAKARARERATRQQNPNPGPRDVMNPAIKRRPPRGLDNALVSVNDLDGFTLRSPPLSSHPRCNNSLARTRIDQELVVTAPQNLTARRRRDTPAAKKAARAGNRAGNRGSRTRYRSGREATSRRHSRTRDGPYREATSRRHRSIRSAEPADIPESLHRNWDRRHRRGHCRSRSHPSRPGELRASRRLRSRNR